MIHPREARSLVLKAARPLAPQKVPIVKALGCPIARDLLAEAMLPPYDRSAMDGYAVGAVEGSDPVVRVRGEATVRDAFEGALGAGEAARISTGGRVPEGAQGIVPIERTVETSEGVRIEGEVRLGQFIRRQGSEIRPGEVLIRAGTALQPAMIGMLGALGIPQVAVQAPPKVAILVTGEEFAGGPTTQGPGRDANGPLLQASLDALGVPEHTLEHVGDDLEALCGALTRAVQGSDVVITTGGASVGNHDHLQAAWDHLGVEAFFHRVAMKPGKPTHAGLLSIDGRPCHLFGLPGNPLAVLTTFELLVAPLLERLGDRRTAPEVVHARLTHPVRRSWRAQFLRFSLASTAHGLEATAHQAQDSGMLRGASVSPWVTCVEAGDGALPAGSVLPMARRAGQAWEVEG